MSDFKWGSLRCINCGVYITQWVVLSTFCEIIGMVKLSQLSELCTLNMNISSLYKP